jgi:hypothetical protein
VKAPSYYPLRDWIPSKWVYDLFPLTMLCTSIFLVDGKYFSSKILQDVACSPTLFTHPDTNVCYIQVSNCAPCLITWSRVIMLSKSYGSSVVPVSPVKPKAVREVYKIRPGHRKECEVLKIRKGSVLHVCVPLI